MEPKLTGHSQQSLEKLSHFATYCSNAGTRFVRPQFSEFIMFWSTKKNSGLSKIYYNSIFETSTVIHETYVNYFNKLNFLVVLYCLFPHKYFNMRFLDRAEPFVPYKRILKLSVISSLHIIFGLYISVSLHS